MPPPGILRPIPLEYIRLMEVPMILLPPRSTSPHQDSTGTAPGGTPPPAQPPPPPQTRGTQSHSAPTQGLTLTTASRPPGRQLGCIYTDHSSRTGGARRHSVPLSACRFQPESRARAAAGSPNAQSPVVGALEEGVHAREVYTYLACPLCANRWQTPRRLRWRGPQVSKRNKRRGPRTQRNDR